MRTMDGTSLTPQEFELHLNDLREKLVAFLERGEGKLGQLRKEAEQVLTLRDQFPEVYDRHSDVEGLVADMLARERQLQVTGDNVAPEPPGCLLSWLLRRGDH